MIPTVRLNTSGLTPSRPLHFGNRELKSSPPAEGDPTRPALENLSLAQLCDALNQDHQTHRQHLDRAMALSQITVPVAFAMLAINPVVGSFLGITISAITFLGYMWARQSHEARAKAYEEQIAKKLDEDRTAWKAVHDAFDAPIGDYSKYYSQELKHAIERARMLVALGAPYPDNAKDVSSGQDSFSK